MKGTETGSGSLAPLPVTGAGGAPPQRLRQKKAGTRPADKWLEKGTRLLGRRTSNHRFGETFIGIATYDDHLLLSAC